MQGYDQTIVRAARLAWAWLILAACCVGPASARGQDASGPEPIGRATDPIALSADLIRGWDEGEVRWLLLQGRAAVIQGGVEGVRADWLVVRVARSVREGVSTSDLEVYAEGQVRPLGKPGLSPRSLRLALRTEAKVEVTSYAGERGLIRLPAAPRGIAVLDRAFPPAARPSAPRPASPEQRPLPLAGAEERPVAGPAPGRAGAEAAPLPPAVEAPAARRDPQVIPTQFAPEGFPDEPTDPAGPMELPPAVEGPGELEAPAAPSPTPPTALEPLPGFENENEPAPPLRGNAPAPAGEKPPPTIPIMPGTQRVTQIVPRNGGPNFLFQSLPIKDGLITATFRGGVTIVTEFPATSNIGIIDVSADNAVLWRAADPKKPNLAPSGEEIVDDANQPMEVYLEGNVIIRQDSRQIAGNGDQKTFHADRAYFDFRTGRAIVLSAQLDMFAPGLIAPTKIKAPRIDQFRPLERGADGKLRYGFERIMANDTMMTGSRFPVPGYRFTSKSVDLTKKFSEKTDPTSGKAVGDPRSPVTQQDVTWQFDARQNIFYLGPVPVFYWPRIVDDIDNIEPALRQIRYGYNNYFGQQVLTDFNGFRLFGFKRPQWIDSWTVDIDYLQLRTTQFPALGTELGWFGKDIIADLTDPYAVRRQRVDDAVPDGYFGYFDIWGLKDGGNDDLGSGPAVVTSNVILPSGIVAGKRGFQRDNVPAFQSFRGRVNFRHMQSLLDSDADPYEDFRFQLEAAYVSDRQFLEEYYKRLSETGLDQETVAYLIRQKENWAWSLWAEPNLQDFNTETQWLPRLDYYRLGDSLLGNRLTYFHHTGVDWANTHTAVEVNNPNIFAFIPYDPISNTSGPLQTGRFYTNHELDLPLNFDNILRVVPYVQGQAVGWNNQLAGESIGRVWGAAGARADIMLWKRYPDAESDIFNVHGLNHKMSFQADYRNAVSNVRLNQIGVQDDLDDNTYEFVRRYFALTQYVGGVLPMQYDPRHLILRRMVSPITGTTDIQGTIQSLQLNFHSRLQTKRGPEKRRRVTDFMTLDVTSTYFPYAARDNFGENFGQNMYNYQWFIGDRTSFVSTGWFEFFKIGGTPTTLASTQTGYPFSLNVVTSGFSISRPPRGNIFLGYTVINTGPVTTSAFNPSISYWLTPKWYGTFSNSYDFGNEKWLAAMFSFTRVGADYLTTFGLVVDPQRNNYSQFAIAISPRASPGMRLGSGTGLTQFDSRFAPTQ